MSYYDANARTGLDGRMTSTTRLGADFAAQIGRCNRSNSTRRASARLLSADKTAYGADRTYHSPTAGSGGGPMPSVELSITAAGKTPSSSQRRLVVRGRRQCYWNGVSISFPILLLRKVREYDTRISTVWPNFPLALAFPIGASNGHRGRVGEKQQGF